MQAVVTSVATNAPAAMQHATLVRVAVFTSFIRTRFYYIEQGNRGAYHIASIANCINEVTMTNRAAIEQNIFDNIFASVSLQIDPSNSWNSSAVSATMSHAMQNLLDNDATEVPNALAPAIALHYAEAVLEAAVSVAEIAGATDFDDTAMSALVAGFLLDPISPDVSALATLFASNGGVSQQL